MRHLKAYRKLSRSSAPRRALLRSLATNFFLTSRIETTEEKAKEAQKVIESLITKAKKDDLASKREVFSFLLQKEAGKRLYSTILPKVADKSGGYTRIVKTGKRRGDGASLSILELAE